MADKSKTIKNATDRELDELLTRLRKEREAQSVIADLCRRASHQRDPITGERVYYDPEISTEEPIESLYHNTAVDNVLAHYGILGMKWGVRRFQPYPKGEGHKGRFIGKSTKSRIKSLKREYGRLEDQMAYGKKANPKINQALSRRMATIKKEIAAEEAKLKKKPEPSEDYTRARLEKKRNYKTLSNKELKDVNERLQLEKQLRELSAADTIKGIEFAKAALAVGSTAASIYALSQTPAGQAAMRRFNKSKVGRQLTLF